jgi:hypothetical protein
VEQLRRPDAEIPNWRIGGFCQCGPRQWEKQLIQCVEARKDYKEIADRILKLRDMRQKTNFDDSAREEYVTRINDILDFIRKQSSELTVFDEALTRCWVKRIVIYGDKYTIEFKSGISVDIQS